jgi:hypothetical protein
MSRLYTDFCVRQEILTHEHTEKSQPNVNFAGLTLTPASPGWKRVHLHSFALSFGGRYEVVTTKTELTEMNEFHFPCAPAIGFSKLSLILGIRT